VWRLKIGQLDVPGAFFDEDGEGLHITDGEKQIDIPVEDAADRLQINADGLLLLNDGKGVNIGMFNPAAPEAGWMFFDEYKISGPEAPLSSAGELNLDIVIDPDGKQIVKIPDNYFAFENANAKPFGPEAIFVHYGYVDGDYGAGPQKEFGFNLNPQEFPELREMWLRGDFAHNPAIRPVRLFDKKNLSDESALALGFPDGKFVVYIFQFMNDPQGVAGGAKPFGMVHLVVPKDTADKLESQGFIESGGVLLPLVRNSVFLPEIYPGKYSELVANLFALQGMNEKSAFGILKESAEKDVVSGDMEKVIWLAKTGNSVLGTPFHLEN
jgi:hypothetical protein